MENLINKIVYIRLNNTNLLSKGKILDKILLNGNTMYLTNVMERTSSNEKDNFFVN